MTLRAALAMVCGEIPLLPPPIWTPSLFASSRARSPSCCSASGSDETSNATSRTRTGRSRYPATPRTTRTSATIATTAAGLGIFRRCNASTGAERATASRSAVASSRDTVATAAAKRHAASSAKPTNTALKSPRSVRVAPVTRLLSRRCKRGPALW